MSTTPPGLPPEPGGPRYAGGDVPPNVPPLPGAGDPYAGAQPPYGAQQPYGAQPPYGAPSPYGAPAPYGYAAPREHPQGTTILVLGILGIVGVCALLGPVAWSMGNKALAEIDRNPAAYSNRGTVAIGRILGIITSVFLILVVVGMIAAFVVLVAVGSTSSSSSISG